MEQQLQRIAYEIKKNIKGKDSVIYNVLCTMLAGGHILLEDVPGVGKTTLALAFSEAMALSYKRVQFTPDVMPSDITGFSMYNNQTKQFEYHQGAAICNLLLADEINRTSPKTQSALLELMEEGKVTVDGITHTLPKPFFVIATENPFGSAGTQRLPESQMDRFMVRLSMGYPNHEASVDILKSDSVFEKISAIVNNEGFLYMQQKAQEIYVDESVYEFIVNVAESTRNSEYIQLGISPRGMKALLRMSKAYAYMLSESYVSIEDVIANIPAVLSHRIVLNSKAKAKDIDVNTVLQKIINDVQAPKITH
ncbi:MAG: MoxR family ATPase [Lachnospiraceae bacterium]|nr:MoxR family ATPase [Lachnospiraceae bacterium]